MMPKQQLAQRLREMSQGWATTEKFFHDQVVGASANSLAASPPLPPGCFSPPVFGTAPPSFSMSPVVGRSPGGGSGDASFAPSWHIATGRSPAARSPPASSPVAGDGASGNADVFFPPAFPATLAPAPAATPAARNPAAKSPMATTSVAKCPTAPRAAAAGAPDVTRPPGLEAAVAPRAAPPKLPLQRGESQKARTYQPGKLLVEAAAIKHDSDNRSQCSTVDSLLEATPATSLPSSSPARSAASPEDMTRRLSGMGEATAFGGLPPAKPLPGLLGAPVVSLPSAGSAGHFAGRCKPCAFVQAKGCQSGIDCKFCHLCEPGEKKRRLREKKAFFGAQRELRRQQAAVHSLAWAA